jgi:hypothetical protein
MGPVAEAQRRDDVRLRQHRLGLLDGEHVARQPHALLGQLQLTRRVGVDAALLAQPPVEQLHRLEVVQLRGHAERAAVLAAAQEDVHAEPLQDGAGDLLRPGQRPLVAPRRERAQVDQPHAHRPLGVVARPHPLREIVDVPVNRLRQRAHRAAATRTTSPDAPSPDARSTESAAKGRGNTLPVLGFGRVAAP